MEPQTTVTESVIEPLKKVTPLSKYLAMILFILMPFLGGYVGYQLAPERVMEVGYTEGLNPINADEITADLAGTETIRADVMDFEFENHVNKEPENVYKEPYYGQFVLVAPDRYVIPAGYFPNYDTPSNNLFPTLARKISEDVSLVQVASPQQPAGPIGTVLFDESSKSIIRTVDFTLNTMDVWVNPHTRIVLEWDVEYKNRLVIYDYMANTSKTLYEESEDEVQLADVCEMGCTGIMYVTTDGNLVFGRHQKIDGTTSTKLLEVVTLPIPEVYRSGM